jgi:RimJ/RimL family protein N-acetyltransferase
MGTATITTQRLELTPLRVGDADAMVGVLADAGLYTFIGGEPPTADGLRGRYSAQVAGSGRPDEEWLNWIVRVDGEPVGYVQATVTPGAGEVPGPRERSERQQHGLRADVAWVIGAPWQGRGYAREAARALVGWLRERGVRTVDAHIHPDHDASGRVAAAAGLTVTDEVVDGERVWRLDILG